MEREQNPKFRKKAEPNHGNTQSGLLNQVRAGVQLVHDTAYVSSQPVPWGPPEHMWPRERSLLAQG